MSGSSHQNALAGDFIEETKAAVGQEYRRIAHNLAQLSEEDVWRRPAPGLNPIGNLILHLCGNLRQWFLHGVGGAEDVRDRPGEFSETGPIAKTELLERMGALVAAINGVLDHMAGDTLLERRRIQGDDTTVLAAIYSTVTHLEGHSLQIAYIAHLFAGSNYDPFWKPRNKEQGA